MFTTFSSVLFYSCTATLCVHVFLLYVMLYVHVWDVRVIVYCMFVEYSSGLLWIE